MTRLPLLRGEGRDEGEKSVRTRTACFAQSVQGCGPQLHLTRQRGRSLDESIVHRAPPAFLKIRPAILFPPEFAHSFVAAPLHLRLLHEGEQFMIRMVV